MILAACSYWAQRCWSAVFNNETMQAVLKLPGFQESPLVKAAEQIKPLEILSLNARDVHTDQHLKSPAINKLDSNVASDEKFSHNNKVIQRIQLLHSVANLYDHRLDYYANQLVYYLLTSQTKAFRMACPKLRSKLVIYSLNSFFCSLAQYFIALAFFGVEFRYYGWIFLVQLWSYISELARYLGVRNARLFPIITVDYHLSQHMFPTVTQCEFQQTSIDGMLDEKSVLCLAPVSEISAKAFMVLWWLVVISIVLELYSLCIILIGSLSHKLASRIYGCMYWPETKREANFVASFRSRRSILFNRCHRLRVMGRQLDQGNLSTMSKLYSKSSPANKQHIEGQLAMPNNNNNSKHLSEREKKRLEAESHLRGRQHPARMQRTRTASGDSQPERLWWPLALLVEVCSTIGRLVARVACCLRNRRRKFYEEEKRFDVNVFYIMYLLYIRLGCSRAQVEEVIRNTSEALGHYLNDLESFYNREDKTSDMSSRVETKGSVDDEDDYQERDRNSKEDPDSGNQSITETDDRQRQLSETSTVVNMMV